MENDLFSRRRLNFMSNTAERFSNRVENYVKYRPNYPPEILQLFKSEMNLQTDSIVADIGAGTGISAKIFLENGNQVFAVEPNEAMRGAAADFLKNYPKLMLVNGTSENTTLKEDSVDFVVAAQAFHWFKRDETRREFERILTDKGYVALIWNERQLDSTDFLRDYESFLHEFATDYQEVRHENISKEIVADFFQTDFEQKTFQMSQTFDYAGLEGRLLSSSYTPTGENPRFAPMIKQLKRLFTKHAKTGRIDFLYDTKVYYGQL